jgi:hypothetical protein
MLGVRRQLRSAFVCARLRRLAGTLAGSTRSVVECVRHDLIWCGGRCREVPGVALQSPFGLEHGRERAMGPTPLHRVGPLVDGGAHEWMKERNHTVGYGDQAASLGLVDGVRRHAQFG